eukprot:147002_1
MKALYHQSNNTNLDINYTNETILKQDHYEYFLKLWNQPNFQHTLNSSTNYEFICSAKYLFEHMHLYCHDNYLPSQDLAQIAETTSGIQCTTISYHSRSIEEQYYIYDVSGSKYERIHWIDFIDQTEPLCAIIFVANLANYNQYVSYGNKKVNKLQESIDLFNSMINGNLSDLVAIEPNNFSYIQKIDNETKYIVYGYIHKMENELKLNVTDFIISTCLLYYFCYKFEPEPHVRREIMNYESHYGDDAHMIVFLNKVDLMEHKIVRYKITDNFQDFKEDCTNICDILQFIKQKFRDVRNHQVQIHFHVTSLIDIQCVKKMFQSCRDIIIRKELKYQTFL